MRGVLFFVCSTSWISRCFRAVIISKQKSWTSCRRELRREGQEKNLCWRNQDQWVWYQAVWARINLPCWIRIHHTVWKLQIGLEFWPHKHWEIRTRQKRKLSVKFSSVTQRWQSFSKYREIGTIGESAFKYRKTGTWSTESTNGDTVESPQSRDLQYSMHWERLYECSTKVESFRRRPDSAGPNSQCIDMGILYVTNNESSDTSWRWLQWQLDHLQEHQLGDAEDVVHRLILNQKYEIQHVSTIEWQFTPWMRCTLVHDKVIKLLKTKTHVYSDSVLCLEKIHGHLDVMTKWKKNSHVSEIPRSTKNYLESTENHVSSSGIYPRTHYSGNSPQDPNKYDGS